MRFCGQIPLSNNVKTKNYTIATPKHPRLRISVGYCARTILLQNSCMGEASVMMTVSCTLWSLSEQSQQIEVVYSTSLDG